MKLGSKKIDIDEAGVTGKLYENIISALKTEMEYHKMLGQEPKIKFLEGSTYEVKQDKRLPEGKIKKITKG